MQYGFQAALQSVPANPTHDMSKQVPAQQTMYSNSGGMPSTAHHHQAGIGGTAPSPSQAQLVNSQHSINRAMSLQVS